MDEVLVSTGADHVSDLIDLGDLPLAALTHLDDSALDHSLRRLLRELDAATVGVALFESAI